MALKMFASTKHKGAKKGSFFKSKIAGSKSNGQFISPVIRSGFEKSFGSDFSSVRIHNDSSAVSYCEKLDARAFTFGNDIFFNAKEYAPHTITGQYLLAHELAHVKFHSKKNNFIFKKGKTTPITGVSTETYLYKVGSNLDQVILYLFNNSKLVKSYYKGSLTPSDWPSAKFLVFDYPQDFASRYKSLHPGSTTDPATIGGFYHRKTDTMNMKRLSTLGHALHEAVHRLGDDKSDGFLGSFISEGLTQLIADIILIENKLPKETNHTYQLNVACANKLIEISDADKILSHYLSYNKDVVTFLFEKIKKKKLNPPTLGNLLGC